MRDKDDPSSNARKAGEALRQGGTALAIPFVLVGPPLVLGYVGSLLAKRWDMPWLVAVGAVVGLIAGIYECIQLVRQIARAS